MVTRLCRKTTVKMETYHRSCEDSRAVADQYKILKLTPRPSAAGISTPGGEVYFAMTRGRRLPFWTLCILETYFKSKKGRPDWPEPRPVPWLILQELAHTQSSFPARDVRFYIVLSPCS